MIAANHTLFVLSVLGLLLNKSLSKNLTFTSLRGRYCSRVVQAPDRQFPVLSYKLREDGKAKETGSATETADDSQSRSTGDEKPMDCQNRSSLVQGTIKESGKHFMVVLRACPTVRKMVLQLRSAGFIRHQRFRQRVFTCSRVHDTVILFKPTTRQVVGVSPRISGNHSDTFSIAWNYEIETEGDTKEWYYSEDVAELPKIRYDERGSRWSSVRVGEPGCGHMACEYLLTYSFVNHTKLVLEISGKSDGWVALGLSSDRKMGGDEVIACKRKSTHGQELEAFSGWIALPHSRPKRKSVGNLQLVGHQFRDGYIYCKMIRSVRINDVGGDTSLDLTADWYQMYARGQIDNSGAMLRHNEIPPTSREQVSMIVPFQIESVTYERLGSSKKKMLNTDENPDSRLAGPTLHGCYLTIFISLFALRFGV